MNFGQIKEGVRLLLDHRTDLDTQIAQWINDTRRRLALEYPFSYLYTETQIQTSAGQQRYDLPSNYLGHLNIFLGSKKLVHIRPNEFDKLYGEVQEYNSQPSRGEPNYYIDRGLRFDLFPVPDGVYTLLIKYYASPTDLVNDTDADYLTQFHKDALVYGAALRGAIYLEDADKETKYASIYSNEVQQLIMREKRKEHTDMALRFRSVKEFTASQIRRALKVTYGA